MLIHCFSRLHPLKGATWEDTIAFHRASRSSCSSTDSLVLVDEEQDEQVDAVIALVMEEDEDEEEAYSEGDSDGGDTDDDDDELQRPPTSDSEFSFASDGGEGENDALAAQVGTPIPSMEGARLPFNAFASTSFSSSGRAPKRPRPIASDCEDETDDDSGGEIRAEDEDESEEEEIRPRKSTRRSEPIHGYAFTKRGYAIKKRK